MPLLKAGDTVKLNPAILEDLTLKQNHHMLSLMLKEDRAGIITQQDLKHSSPKAFFYWVKFSFFTIRLSEFHLLPSLS
jgi:hypothetical protein